MPERPLYPQKNMNAPHPRDMRMVLGVDPAG
ncbi:hypothetical protein QO011_000899 [Labrys wisconsinensis]|uniref:Uncharacterized protein n=1 Tax=Labrys wisconsinensis TaxID=425677 RepID=A0ABU0J0W0_9HYPH|nr:hypothetical protein [Labrys wisconsinensis]